MEEVESVLSEEAKAKNKQKLRSFKTTLRKTLASWRNTSPTQISTLDSQLAFLKSQLSRPAENEAAPPPATLTREEQTKLTKAFERLKDQAAFTANWNRRDPTAPYLTPWRPRDYMSAFAFIPRYLEVNQNICAAVYLRHPVARPGLAEVPTPFGYETGQLAFNWYLRRR